MELHVLMLVSVIVSVAFMFFIYMMDTEKEPLSLLLKCIFGGCIAVVPVILIEMLVQPMNSFVHSFYAAGLKFLFLFPIIISIIWKNKEFDQYYDGIVYAVFASLGFACTENLGIIAI